MKWWEGAKILIEAGADPLLCDFEHGEVYPIYFAHVSLKLKNSIYASPHPLFTW